jgi:hypothetical protein
MSTKKTKWDLLVGSILGILVLIFGCVGVINILGKENSSEKFPIRTFIVQIDENQREELFVQLRNFANEHDLEFYLSFYENKEVFLIVMYGNQLEIAAQPIPESSKQVRVSFFEEDPSNPPSRGIVDALLSDLKKFINEIPNVTIMEEQ